MPQADANGNDIPGIRTFEVQVPLATYTGWALRRAPFAANEDCALTGQYIPFKVTSADRQAAGDPRLSVQERYPTYESYYGALVNAINDLTNNRLLLCEDVQSQMDRVTTWALTAGVPARQAPVPGSRRSAALALPSCIMSGQ